MAQAINQIAKKSLYKLVISLKTCNTCNFDRKKQTN